MESKRLRPHSASRFSESQHRFSLKESLETLRGEAHAGVGGHRQMTIFHRAPVTMVLFAFEADGELSDHAASGPVAVVKAPDDALKGVLPMKIDGESGANILGVTVMPDGTVGLQWLIAGKPYLGRPTFIFKASSFPNYLSKLINFGGAKRRMKLTLESERVKETSTGTRPPIRRRNPSVRKKKEPIGKRYKLTGRLVVTDSSDGFLDNTCEITGVLMYSAKRILRYPFKNA